MQRWVGGGGLLWMDANFNLNIIILYSGTSHTRMKLMKNLLLQCNNYNNCSDI